MRLIDRCDFMMFIFTALLLRAGGSSISAQQKPPAQPNCPVTKVSCLSEVYVKNMLRFIAQVSGGASNVQPTYNWTVSSGSIASGQGTSTIEVDTSGVEADSTVTATVDLGGFDRACAYGSTASSCTTSVIKRPVARKLDEYGRLTPKDEGARLDSFLIELNSDPTAQAHIISYNARTGRPGDAQKAADRAKDYLVKKRGLDPSRLVTVTGGSRDEPMVELWIVPVGAQLPKPTAAIKSGASNPAPPSKPEKPL